SAPLRTTLSPHEASATGSLSFSLRTDLSFHERRLLTRRTRGISSPQADPPSVSRARSLLPECPSLHHKYKSIPNIPFVSYNFPPPSIKFQIFTLFIPFSGKTM